MSFSGNVTSMDMAKFSSAMIIAEQAKMIKQLKKENEELKSALEFYAAKNNWSSVHVGYGDLVQISVLDREDISNTDRVVECGGKRARLILSQNIKL